MFTVTNKLYKEVFVIKRENKITLSSISKIEPMYSVINTLRYHSNNNHTMHHYNMYLLQIF